MYLRSAANQIWLKVVRGIDTRAMFLWTIFEAPAYKHTYARRQSEDVQQILADADLLSPGC